MAGAGGTDDAELNFSGDFAEGAAESIAATEALAAAMVKLQDASERIKDPKFLESDKISAQVTQVNALAAARAKVAGFDATYTKALAEQEKIYAKMRDDALGITAARNKESNKALEGQALTAAGDALATAGAVVLAAGAAIATGAAALERAGIATTDKHNTEGAIGGHLGGDYERSVFLSLKAGIDPDATWTETKRLLVAKFSEQEIPALIRIKTGMDAAGENGGGFLAELQKLKLEPKVQSRDVDRLWKLGLDSKAVYEELAHTLGTDVAGATAKVKAGAASSSDVIAALVKVAGSGKFGAIADEQAATAAAAFGRLKGDAAELFDFGPDALGGIKGALGNVIDVVEGGEGVALRASMADLFHELNQDLLGGFQGEEGKARIKEFAASVTSSLHTITDAVHSVSAAADDLSGLWKKIDWSGAPSWLRPDSSKATDKPPSEPPSANAQTFTSTNGGEAVGAGTDLSRGIAQGIRTGEIDVTNAARDVVRAGVDAAKAEGKIHSPSEEMAEEVGEPMAAGVGVGMARNTSPAAAGRAMAAGAVQAAQGGGAAAAGGGGSTGGSTIHEGDVYVSIAVTGGGASAEQDWQKLQPVVEKCVRRIRRDGLEGARP